MNDEQILRHLLWMRHGCESPALYGDDGEMQCARCRIDFRRMPARDIRDVFLRQSMKELQKWMQEKGQHEKTV